jgi:hypothetical protein
MGIRLAPSRASGAASASVAPRTVSSAEFHFDEDELRRDMREALFDGPVALVKLDSVDLGVARKGNEVAPPERINPRGRAILSLRLLGSARREPQGLPRARSAHLSRQSSTVRS